MLCSHFTHYLQVDVHIMTKASSGEWQYYGTEVTDSTGRAAYTMKDNQRLSMGIYPVKMVVRSVWYF